MVPLVLLVTALAGDESSAAFGWDMARLLFSALLLVAAIVVILRYVFPRLVSFSAEGANRDLPALLAIVTAVGCAWGADTLGLSPLLGAFVGVSGWRERRIGLSSRGSESLENRVRHVVLRRDRHLDQSRASARAWSPVCALTAGIVLGKAIIVLVIGRLFRLPAGVSAVTGLCLGQIGEFSFVLLDIARHTQLIGTELFELMVSVIVATLFVTPYLVARHRVWLGSIERHAPATGHTEGVSPRRSGTSF